VRWLERDLRAGCAAELPLEDGSVAGYRLPLSWPVTTGYALLHAAEDVNAGWLPQEGRG
jgi:hypothetical protein